MTTPPHIKHGIDGTPSGRPGDGDTISQTHPGQHSAGTHEIPVDLSTPIGQKYQTLGGQAFTGAVLFGAETLLAMAAGNSCYTITEPSVTSGLRACLGIDTQAPAVQSNVSIDAGTAVRLKPLGLGAPLLAKSAVHVFVLDGPAGNAVRQVAL